MERSTQPASPQREAHLRDYWKIVWQGRWTVFAVFAVVSALTATWTFLQTPVFRATATVEVQPQARRVMAGRGDVSGLGAAGYGWLAEEKYHNTQIEIIKSYDVAGRVMDELGLRDHPMFVKARDPVESFRRMIRVDPRRDTGLLEISIFGSDPTVIREWVNAVAQQYVSRNMEQARANIQRAVDAIRQEMDKLELRFAEAETARIDSLEDDINTETKEEVVRQQLAKYNTELTEVEIERNKTSDILRQVRELRAADLDPSSVPEIANDPTLQALHENRTTVERELASAKVELRPDHPQYERKRSELEKIKERIEGHVNQAVLGLETQVRKLNWQEQFLRERIELAEQYSVQVARASSGYEIRRTQAENAKQVFDLITTTLSEAQLSVGLMTNNVSVLDVAQQPQFPVKPRKRVNLMVGAMLGLFLGVGVVFFLDYLDNTIRTPEDVEKYLGLSVLAVVPRMGEEAKGQRAVREAYQSLRTSVIFSSKNRQRRVILVTSTGPREGKSSTVANLGRTLAAAGDRVVVIDCDLRRPTQHVHHEVEQKPGLTNFLAAPTDEKDWTAFARELESGRLLLLPCGPIPPNPPELLGSPRLIEMLAEMRENYDWILIDSPPAASLADASLLAAIADMVVFVVQHNSTDRDVVIKTAQQIRAVNTSIAGVVLNNVDLDRSYMKDYYYAGYYYLEDAGEGKTRRRGADKKAQVG